MNTAEKLQHTGLRHHPKLEQLFKQAESRHLTDDELQRYLSAASGYAAHAQAAQEIAKAEAWVVRKTLKEIFEVFPYAEHHKFSSEKCTRDVSYVSAYATLSMLMDDPQWLNDKLLYWLRTILHAFEFPGQPKPKPIGDTATNADTSEIYAKASQLPAHIGSIYATYSLLRLNYKTVLSPAAWQLIEPYLSQVIEVLTAE